MQQENRGLRAVACLAVEHLAAVHGREVICGGLGHGDGPRLGCSAPLAWRAAAGAAACELGPFGQTGYLVFLDALLPSYGRLAMDRFDAIRTLIAAVDGGSLSAASRALGVPLPTVSRKVSELEAHLGTQMVVRTSRKLLLTDAGHAFVQASRRVLSDLDEAERAASGEYQTPRGELLITAPIMFGKLHILPVVLEFLRAYPAVNVRLLLADSVVDLVDNRIDVAARLGRLPDSGMVAVRVGELRWITCASPELPGQAWDTGHAGRPRRPRLPGVRRASDAA